MTTRVPKYLLGMTLDANSLLLADGTVWSHAATLGTRYKGGTFTIDQPTVENFVKVFSTGYPQKIPVDYEHGSTSPDPEIRKLRAQGKVPKAGDVLELRPVFSVADFTGDLKTAAEQLSASVGRALDDARNFGLWQRWRPTAQALQAIKDGEYSELSICFDDDWPNNTTGEGQGPAVLAVGLVMRPFLDDMLPVAASQDDDGRAPAAPGTTSQEREMTQKLTMLSVVAAVLATPVATEEDAITALQAIAPELKRTREFSAIVSAEFANETDPAKIAGTVRQLRADNERLSTEAKGQKALSIKTTVDATMTKHEKKLTVPLRESLAAQLTAELEAGKKLEETSTVKVLESLPTSSAFGQHAGADVGTSATDVDKVNARAKQLMNEDAEVKDISTRQGYSAGLREATKRATRELSAK